MSLVPAAGHGRPQIRHRADGRYEPMDPHELMAFARGLAARITMDGVDYVVGFPEGGALPAFAFAQVTARPLVLSTRLRLALSPVISFDEPHTSIGVTHHVHGLREGHRVVIIEDEVTSGRTLVNAVRALRAAGVQVDDVGVLLAVDHPALWKLMKDEKVSLHAQARLPAEYAELLRSTR